MAAGAPLVISLTRERYLATTNPRLRSLNPDTGVDVSICEFAMLVRETVSFGGNSRFLLSRPNGTPQKCLAKRQAKGTRMGGYLAVGRWFAANMRVRQKRPYRRPPTSINNAIEQSPS